MGLRCCLGEYKNQRQKLERYEREPEAWEGWQRCFETEGPEAGPDILRYCIPSDERCDGTHARPAPALCQPGVT